MHSYCETWSILIKIWIHDNPKYNSSFATVTCKSNKDSCVQNKKYRQLCAFLMSWRFLTKGILNRFWCWDKGTKHCSFLKSIIKWSEEVIPPKKSGDQILYITVWNQNAQNEVNQLNYVSCDKCQSLRFTMQLLSQP